MICTNNISQSSKTIISKHTTLPITTKRLHDRDFVQEMIHSMSNEDLLMLFNDNTLPETMKDRILGYIFENRQNSERTPAWISVLSKPINFSTNDSGIVSVSQAVKSIRDDSLYQGRKWLEIISENNKLEKYQMTVIIESLVESAKNINYSQKKKDIKKLMNVLMNKTFFEESLTDFIKNNNYVPSEFVDFALANFYKDDYRKFNKLAELCFSKIDLETASYETVKRFMKWKNGITLGSDENANVIEINDAWKILSNNIIYERTERETQEVFDEVIFGIQSDGNRMLKKSLYASSKRFSALINYMNSRGFIDKDYLKKVMEKHSNIEPKSNPRLTNNLKTLKHILA